MTATCDYVQGQATLVISTRWNGYGRITADPPAELQAYQGTLYTLQIAHERVLLPGPDLIRFVGMTSSDLPASIQIMRMTFSPKFAICIRIIANSLTSLENLNFGFRATCSASSHVRQLTKKNNCPRGELISEMNAKCACEMRQWCAQLRTSLKKRAYAEWGKPWVPTMASPACMNRSAPRSYKSPFQLWSNPMHTLLLLSITSSVALVFWKYVILRKQKRPYPPGPKSKPIIGNFFDFPTKDLANVYLEWGKKYNSGLILLFCPLSDTWAIGSIIHASAFGNHVVVVNKFEDAAELLERRAQKYSDRPEYPTIKLWVNTKSAIKF